MFVGYNVASNSCSTTGENMSFKNTWLFSLLSHIDVILVLRFTKWVICLLILVYGLLDVYRHYLEFLAHPDWSAAHYVVFIYIIPYVFIDIILFLGLHYLLKV